MPNLTERRVAAGTFNGVPHGGAASDEIREYARARKSPKAALNVANDLQMSPDRALCV
jgi:hypothetical protein